MADGLEVLGIAPGTPVRWRVGSNQRWMKGTVTRRERDGSVGIVDARGLARSVTVERIEVATTGPRGGAIWEPLVERASRSEQLHLL